MLADLDSKQFAVRQQATTALAAFGESARPALEKALAGAKLLEARRRLEGLLNRVDPLAPESLRAARAVEVLEHVATPAARKLLQALAEGAPEARLTQQARVALGRLKIPEPR